LVGYQAGNKLLRKPSCRWEDNIKIDLKKIGWDGMDWIIWFGVGTIGGIL
jgi:hypothetical protein